MEKKKTLHNWIVRNLLLACVALVGLVLVVNILLAVITQHNREIEVPDITNMSLSEAGGVAAHKGLKIVVADSVYVRGMQKGAVYSQNPKAGAMVKKGRKIHLTTNAVIARKVAMPSLVGCSMRQAKAELASKGLMLGRLIYVGDIATNNVLRQLFRNREIREGDQVESGSKIDLVVGLNGDDCTTYVPDVTKMRLLRAVDAVQDNSLNIGRLVFDSSVENYSDSLNAVVYRQSPLPSEYSVSMGSEVDLYLTVDGDRI